MISVWEKNNRTSYMPPALIGLSRDYPKLTQWLDEALKPDKKDFFWKSQTQCYDANWEDYAALKVEDFFKKGLDAFQDPIARNVLESAGKQPLFY
jgi:hypothetical protein